MTPDEAVRAVRILARARNFDWPMVIASGVHVTTESSWRDAVDLPGNLAELETQLDGICAKYERDEALHARWPRSDADAGDVDELEERSSASPSPGSFAGPPPDPDDILLAVQGEWWRVVELSDGRMFGGTEANWREAVKAGTYDLIAIWQALGRSAA